MSTDIQGPRLMPTVSERDHVQGSARALVTLVEYGDYECPFCGAAYPIVKQIQRQLGDKMLFAFRNFPLATAHPHAIQAAEAAEAASPQEQFWEMHDTLYENQKNLEFEHLLSYAEGLDLDLGLFEQDLVENTYLSRIQEDFRNGVRSGVNGTPTFFINGIRHEGGWDMDSLLAGLQAAIRAGV